MEKWETSIDISWPYFHNKDSLYIYSYGYFKILIWSDRWTPPSKQITNSQLPKGNFIYMHSHSGSSGNGT